MHYDVVVVFLTSKKRQLSLLPQSSQSVIL